MPRYALKIEYDGAPFSGWQRQADRPSVQAVLEAALRRLDSGASDVAAAGRTDAGVHARGQVAHVDMVRDWAPYRLAEAANHHLRPAPVAIVAVARVADDWHARFGASGRRYRYRIVSRRAVPVLDADRVWTLRPALDVAAMQAGAARLLGHHDFTTFRSADCQARSPMKTLDRLDVVARPYPQGTEVRFEVAARSFLHNQVRSLVGSLVRVGTGSWAPDDIARALAARDRAACGPVAPAHGLTLMAATYPDDPFESGPVETSPPDSA